MWWVPFLDQNKHLRSKGKCTTNETRASASFGFHSDQVVTLFWHIISSFGENLKVFNSPQISHHNLAHGSTGAIFIDSVVPFSWHFFISRLWRVNEPKQNFLKTFWWKFLESESFVFWDFLHDLWRGNQIKSCRTFNRYFQLVKMRLNKVLTCF